MNASRARIRSILPQDLLAIEETIFETNIATNRLCPAVFNLNFKTIKSAYNQKLYDIYYAYAYRKGIRHSDMAKQNLWFARTEGYDLDEDQEYAANIKYNTTDNPCRKCKMQGLPSADCYNVKVQLIQKRSSDEPMTLELECQTCGSRWNQNG